MTNITSRIKACLPEPLKGRAQLVEYIAAKKLDIPLERKVVHIAMRALMAAITIDEGVRSLKQVIVDPARQYVSEHLESRRQEKELCARMWKLAERIEVQLLRGNSIAALPLFSEGLKLFITALRNTGCDPEFAKKVADAVFSVKKEDCFTLEEYQARVIESINRTIKEHYYNPLLKKYSMPKLLWHFKYLTLLFKLGYGLGNVQLRSEYFNFIDEAAKDPDCLPFIDKVRWARSLVLPKTVLKSFEIYRDNMRQELHPNPLLYYPAALLSFPMVWSVSGIMNFNQVKLNNHGSDIFNRLVFEHFDRIFKGTSVAEVVSTLSRELSEEDGRSGFHAIHALATLAQHNLPLIEMAAGEVIPVPRGRRINIALCGSAAEDNITLLMQAARQSAAFPFLILDPSWIKTNPWQRRIEAEKGIVYQDGRLVYGKFSSPLPIHYINNYFLSLPVSHELTMAAAGIPRSGDKFMTAFSEEKGVVNHVLRAAGLNMPPWITFVSRPNRFYRAIEKEDAGVKIINKKSKPEEVEKILREFVFDQFCAQIVIKPSTGSCGRGIRFFKVSSSIKGQRAAMIADAAKYVIELRKNGENALVQARIVNSKLEIDGKVFDANLRVFVSRGKDDRPAIADIAVRVDDKCGPVNLSLTASAMTFDQYCLRLGISGGKKRKLFDAIKKQALGAFNALHDRAKDFSALPHRIDFAGVDIILGNDGKEDFVPYILEINDYHSGGMWDLDQVAPEKEKGRSSKLFVKTMIRRGREYQEKGRPGVRSLVNGLISAVTSDS